MYACDYLPPVENPSLTVGNFLQSKGVIIASLEGKPLDYFSDMKYIGIVITNEKLKKEFIGVVFFDDEKFGAHGKNWVFKVSSMKFMEQAKGLIVYMLDEFHMPILLSFSSR